MTESPAPTRREMQEFEKVLDRSTTDVAAFEELVREHRAQVEVLHLTDPVLWGGATGDERYLVVSTR